MIHHKLQATKIHMQRLDLPHIHIVHTSVAFASLIASVLNEGQGTTKQVI